MNKKKNYKETKQQKIENLECSSVLYICSSAKEVVYFEIDIYKLYFTAPISMRKFILYFFELF